jgi:hypothetical protein
LKIYGNATKSKKRSRNYRRNSPRNLNLANKILDEKSNKFTEQNKENMKTSCPLARQDSIIREK